MKSLLPLAAFAFTLVVSEAGGHGPTPQKIDEHVVLAAPADKVWAVVGDFAAPERWNPAIRAARADKGNRPGSARVLALAGGEVEEVLDERDEANRSLDFRSGRVDLKALPVGSYSGRIRVLPQGNGSRVEWRARAYRADTGNEPAPGRDDEAAVQALGQLIRSGLEKLRQDFGPAS